MTQSDKGTLQTIVALLLIVPMAFGALISARTKIGIVIGILLLFLGAYVAYLGTKNQTNRPI